ncbi:Lutropin subunit beta, partial [Eschrichtius robustus]|nr:Lutropin subunit beta [Eschrichtius robustus]
MEMLQGLLLLLLLSVAGVWAPRGPLRPLCRPINATLAAENEACPVCITFTTSICAGYCPSMGLGMWESTDSPLDTRVWDL